MVFKRIEDVATQFGPAIILTVTISPVLWTPLFQFAEASPNG